MNRRRGHRAHAHLPFVFLLPLLALRAAGVGAPPSPSGTPAPHTDTSAGAAISSTIRYPLSADSGRSEANLRTAAILRIDDQNVGGGAGLQQEQMLADAITALNASELPDARAALVRLGRGNRTFPCVACGWAATLLTSKHMPQAIKLVAKSHSQAAELSALATRRANVSDAVERTRLAALDTLCRDNENAAVRLQDQIDQLLKAALPPHAPGKAASECGPMCILALRQRVAYFARQVQDLTFRQEHTVLPPIGINDVKTDDRADGVASGPAPWFYKGAQDLTKEGHWSGVQGLVKDRWDWFTSKCDSVQGTPGECAAAVRAARKRGLWGKLFHLLQDRSAPSVAPSVPGTLDEAAQKSTPHDGTEVLDSGSTTQRDFMLSKAWTTMHNFPRDDDGGASAAADETEQPSRPGLRAGAGGGGADDVIVTRYSPVYARWQGDCFFEPATVTRVNADGTFELRYYSGKLESHASKAHLKPQSTQGDTGSCEAPGCVLVLGGGCEGTWPTPMISAASEAAANVAKPGAKTDQELEDEASAADAGKKKDEVYDLLGGEMKKLGLPDSTIEAFDQAAQKQEKDDAKVKDQLEAAAAAIASKEGGKKVGKKVGKKGALGDGNNETEAVVLPSKKFEDGASLHSAKELEEEAGELADLLNKESAPEGEQEVQYQPEKNNNKKLEAALKKGEAPADEEEGQEEVAMKKAGQEKKRETSAKRGSGEETEEGGGEKAEEKGREEVAMKKAGKEKKRETSAKSGSGEEAEETAKDEETGGEKLKEAAHGATPCNSDANCASPLRCKRPPGKEFLSDTQMPYATDTVCMEGNPLGSNCEENADCLAGAICTRRHICDWPGGIGDECDPQPEDSCLAPLACNAERQCAVVAAGSMEQSCRDRDEVRDKYLKKKETPDIASAHPPDVGACDEGLICSAGRVCRGDAGTPCVRQSQCHDGLECSNGLSGELGDHEISSSASLDDPSGGILIDPVTGAHYVNRENKYRGDFESAEAGAGVGTASSTTRTAPPTVDAENAKLRGDRPRLREKQALVDESPSVCIYRASSIPAGKDTRQYAATGVRPGMLNVERGAVECCPCVPPPTLVFLQRRVLRGLRSRRKNVGVGNDVLAANENGQWHPSSVNEDGSVGIGLGQQEDASDDGAGRAERAGARADENGQMEANSGVVIGQRPDRHGEFGVVHPDCCACPLPGADRSL